MISKWIRRKRNSRGFGVQSPGDFFFVQHVLREKSCYYGYEELHEVQRSVGSAAMHYPGEINRLLFRLANYVHPEVIVEVGTGAGLSAYAMTLAHPKGKCVTISEHDDTTILSTFPQVRVERGDEVKIFCQLVSQLDTIKFLHVAHTKHYREVVNYALPHVCDKTLIVIEGIRDSKEKLAWWKELLGSPLTGVCYDAGNIGLIFFDKRRHKTTYWINLSE